jgi:flagellar hook assembly protein FlgD
MKTTLFFLAIVLILSSSIHAQSDILTNTPGTLNFSVRTITDNGTYSPKNIIAIWIKTSSGSFVRSMKVMADQRKQFLYQWKINSGGNVTDAVTGPTLMSHQIHTFTWNCKDLTGAVVPDGDYIIMIEYTDQDGQGPFAGFTFTKGVNPQTLIPQDQTYIKDISIQYTPQAIGVEEYDKQLDIFTFPNPFSDKFMIILPEGYASAEISFFNSSGEKLSMEYTFSDPHFIWDGKDRNGNTLPSGMYIYKIVSGNDLFCGKVFFVK